MELGDTSDKRSGSERGRRGGGLVGRLSPRQTMEQVVVHPSLSSRILRQQKAQKGRIIILVLNILTHKYTVKKVETVVGEPHRLL